MFLVLFPFIHHGPMHSFLALTSTKTLNKKEFRFKLLTHKVYCFGGKCHQYKGVVLTDNSVTPTLPPPSPARLVCLLYTPGKAEEIR